MEKLGELSKHESETWPKILDQIKSSLDANESIEEFYAHFADPKKGVSGYIYHTVPVALYAWFKSHRDDLSFEVSLISVLNMGGDTDTTGAIAGAILGAIHRIGSFPEGWISRISDWPRSKGYLSHTCESLTNGGEVKRIITLFALLRNILFLGIVLLHGFSRLLPGKLRRIILK